MSKARGKALEFDPVQVAGLDDNVWQKQGTSTASMGVVFSLRGEDVKSPGIAPLVHSWGHHGDKSHTPVNPFAGHQIVSVGTFQRDGATDILVEFNGGIYLLEGDVVTLLIDGRYKAKTPANGSRFVQVANVLLILNGRDPNLKWDGVKMSPIGIATVPGAPTIAETERSSGSLVGPVNINSSLVRSFSIRKDGSNTSDPYSYRMTWVNDAGQESEAGPKSNEADDADVVNDKRYVILVVELSGEPPSDDIIGRVLYRSTDGVTYYEVAYLPGSTTDTYFDSTPIAGNELSAELTPSGKNLPPPISKWAFEFRGRTYYGGAIEDPLLLHYSQPGGDKEAVGSDNYILIGSDGGDEITGFGTGGDYALIFTNRSTHMLTHDKTSQPIMTPISRSVGAISDRAVVSFGQRVYFLSEDGLFGFDGSKIKPLSNMISSQIKNLPNGYLKDVVSWSDARERRIYFSVVTGASSTNNEVWSIHVDTGAVSKLPFPVTAAVRYKGETIVGFNYPGPSAIGSPVHELGVWDASNSLGLSETGFEGRFETRWMTGANPQTDKTYFRLDVFYVQTANKDMTVTWQTEWDRAIVGSTTFKLADPDALTWDEVSGGSPITWGSLYDGKTWDEARVRCKRIDLGVTDSAKYPSGSPLTAKSIKINFSTTADKSPWKLVGFILHSEDHGIRGEGTDSK